MTLNRFAPWLVALLFSSAVAARAQESLPAVADGGPEVEQGAPLAEEEVAGPVLGEADLQPYFGTGALKKAKAELDAGRGAAALKLLPAKPKDVPTRWLRALALRAAGQNKPARAELEKLAAAAGPLADRALYLAGLCAVETGDGAGAVRLLQRVSPHATEAGEAYLEAARQLQRLRPPKVAAAAVEEAVAPILASAVRGDPAAAHLIAGDAFLAAGNKDRAREHYRTAWLDHPLSGASSFARDRARKLPGGPPIPPARLLRRAEALVEGGRNREALSELASLKLPSLCALGCPGDRTPGGLLKAALSVLVPTALPAEHQPTPADVARGPVNPGDPLSCRARLTQGRAFKRLHKSAEARTALAPVALRCEDPEVRAKALFILAQIESAAGHPEGEALLLALAGRFPSSVFADDALFLAAVARRKAGDLGGHRQILTRLVVEQPRGDQVTEALFRLFWSYFTEGKPREGVQWLDQLVQRPDPDGASEERARYWRARALLLPVAAEPAEASAKARAAGLEDLRWLARERPLTYHGLLARSRLAELSTGDESALEAEEARFVQKTSLAAPEPLRLGVFAQDNHLLAAVEYLRLGMRLDAIRELSALDRRPARAAGERGQEPLTLVADLYFRAGDLRAAHNLVRTELRSFLRRPSTALSLRAAVLAYPLAFRKEIADVAGHAAIPPDLLQALMREESALDPHAVSPVGALGLTQLMPRTALSVAKRLKLRGYATKMLFEPAVNIRIGGTYLGQLFGMYKSAALALASYNAGPGNVNSWVRDRGALPLDAFVEEIPLDETRGYVKRCLRSFAAYRYLYGEGSGRVPRVGQGTVAAR